MKSPRTVGRARYVTFRGSDLRSRPTSRMCAIAYGVIVVLRDPTRAWRAYASFSVVAAVVALVLIAAGASSAALAPIGESFQVSTATSGYCLTPRAAVRPDGGFHVVWQEFDPTTAPSGWDVRGRRFDENGMPLGGSQTINSYTVGSQESPVVAIADGGEFVVTWSGAGDGDENGVFARVYDSGGAPKTDDLPLHAVPDLYERGPSAASAGNGFLVAWVEDSRIAGARMDLSGSTWDPFENPVDEPARVALDRLPGGDFVVVWSSSQYASNNVAYGETGKVEGRVFAAGGTAGDGFQVNAGRDDPTGYGFVVDGAQTLSVAADAVGNFVAGFDSYVPSYVYNVDEQVDGYNLGAKTERFIDGTSQGAEFVAGEPATVVAVSVATTPGGNVVIVQEGNEILARALDCHGADISGGDVDVDGEVPLGTEHAAVSVNESGDVVIVWKQGREGSSGSVIFGRRLLLTDGCVLCGDADANGRITAVDALAALRASVGLETCALNRCDTDGSLGVTATDALRILSAAVEASGPPTLSCTSVASGGAAAALADQAARQSP